MTRPAQPMPKGRRKPGVTSRPVGRQVIGAKVFPEAGEDPRQGCHVLRDDSKVETTFAKKDDE